MNYNSIANLPTISSFDNACTLKSILFVSDNTILNNSITINTTLNKIGNILGSGTALIDLNCSTIQNPPNFINFINLPLSGGSMSPSIVMTGSISAFILEEEEVGVLLEQQKTGAFSTAAISNDCILRSRRGEKLILQSGGYFAGFILNSNDSGSINIKYG
jgi:hypothetical protein